MQHLETTFGTLKLKNPLIAASSGLTNSVDKIKELASQGIGAVVLKSLFEEQIVYDIEKQIQQSLEYPEVNDYIATYVKTNSVKSYLNLISEAKSKTTIPIIASVNCYNNQRWIEFAKDIQKAGADALEVNVYFLPTDKNKSSADYENIYFSLLSNLKKELSIPIIFKIGNQFTNLTAFLNRLKADGVSGVTMFNRFYEPDIDIEHLTLTSSEIFSSSSELRKVIRWIAIANDKVKGLDISASTGIHNHQAAIKCILAGASAVQLCSTIYKNSPKVIPEILSGIEQWMKRKNFASVNDFKGLLSYKKIPDPGAYERAQFMKHFSNMD
ncbi:MAG TPA: dihydroorotate dehydrogenase-like protein [Salinivirgaceae bacterium]|nr:dihydroorotate dehydrogenase-like protein [Salinivirgaceae bacterium]